jgi:dsRNA-specific ribonuclease
MHGSALQHPPNNFEKLQERIGYTFKNIILLKQALTRQSAIEERKQSREIGSNQRLEFLGDKVLNLAVSQLIFQFHPDWPEGKLTTETARFVNNKGPLSTIAQQWHLGKYLIIGRGEELNKIREDHKALSDAVEAILGAIFEDSDADYKLIKQLIAKHWAILGLVKPTQLLLNHSHTFINSDNTLPNLIYLCDTPDKITKIKICLAQGVSANELDYAVMNCLDNIEILKILCDYKINQQTLNQSLIICIQQGLSSQLALLLLKGAEANTVHECTDTYWYGDEECSGEPYTRSALQLAVTHYGCNAIEMARILLQYDADPNWQGSTYQITKNFKRMMTISEAMTYKPDIEIKEDKSTALHLVVDGDNTDKSAMIRLLAGKMLDLNLGDEEGNTSLHRAASRCAYDDQTYSLLVKLGANQDKKNNSNDTPRQLSQRVLTVWEKPFSHLKDSARSHQLLFSAVPPPVAEKQSLAPQPKSLAK